MVGRGNIDLSSGWEFIRQRADRGWLRFRRAGKDTTTVDLPHSWNVLDTFQEGVEYYRGPGSYRRTFVLPEGARPGTAWLRADGFYGTGDAWVNDRRVARVDGQYLGFALSVAQVLRPGAENHVAIRLTNRCSRWVLPGISEPDFLLHGGLAGRVWLEFAGEVHLEEGTTCASPVRAHATGWGVETSATVVNAGRTPASVAMAWTLRALDGLEVGRQTSTPVTLAPSARTVVAARVPAPGVQLWSTETPRLYEVEASLIVDGAAVDGWRRRIGFRTAEFLPYQGFFLNGQRLFLRGCNRHESLPGLGSALPAALHRADATVLRDMGLNFVRLSHYPQSPAFLDACDELGLLVYAELASWKSVRNGLWLRRALRQFEALIRRDRHHAAVIVWGMGNESRSRNAYTRLRAAARRLDPGRPVTYAENHLYRARRQGTLGLADVWGCNYELDLLGPCRDAARLRNVIVTECSNAPHAVRGDLAAERQQVAQLEADLPRIEAPSFVAGFALWCFNDYATLRKRRYLRHCGIVDAWREPKLAAFWLRARHGSGPFVKLATDWSDDVAGHGELRQVDVFSTLDAVEVRINARCVHTLRGRGHHVLTVPFALGRIEAVAGPPEAVADGIDSFGAAAGLVLEWSNELPRALLLRIVDASGHWVRDWHGDVALEAQGSARAFPYRAGHVRVDGGIARVHVGAASAGSAGAWRASDSRLGSATVALGDTSTDFRLLLV